MAAKKRPSVRGFHIYCDESSTTAHRYMVYAGIIVATNNLPKLRRLMAEWRTATGMHRELKWEKVSKKKYPEYVSLVDLLFDLIRSRRVHFKCFVLDTRDKGYRAFSEGDSELGFYKFYYQFLLR